jgi:hypothetical protein
VSRQRRQEDSFTGSGQVGETIGHQDFAEGSFSMDVVPVDANGDPVSGSGATWTVVLDGAMINVSTEFNAIPGMTHTDTDPDICSTGGLNYLVFFRRARVVALSLGTAAAIKVYSIGR